MIRKWYSVVNFSYSLLLTFSVNQQDLVVGENVAARGYTIPLIKIIPMILIISVLKESVDLEFEMHL